MLISTAARSASFDRLAQQLLGTRDNLTRPAVMPMDAHRERATWFVLSSSTCPASVTEAIDIDVERNVADNPRREARSPGRRLESRWPPERPKGLFSRQLVLGENLDLERIEAGYDRRRPDPAGSQWPNRQSLGKVEVSVGSKNEQSAISS